MIGLMIVVAIIGILAVVTVPRYQNYVACSEGASALATINPLKTIVEESLSRGIASNEIKIGTTASTAAETYVGVTPDANKSGVIAVTIEDSGAGDISFTFQTGTSSPKNITKVTILGRTAGGVWTCRSTQDEVFIPKGCAG